LNRERPSHADSEEERADRWADELIAYEISRLQPVIAGTQIVVMDQHGHQCLRCRIGEDLANTK
jgi:hypothetical protein